MSFILLIILKTLNLKKLLSGMWWLRMFGNVSRQQVFICPDDS